MLPKKNPDRIVATMVRQRYLITTTGGETFAGILYDADPNTLVLADASAIAANGDRAPVDGQLIIPRHTVKYLQTINP